MLLLIHLKSPNSNVLTLIASIFALFRKPWQISYPLSEYKFIRHLKHFRIWRFEWRSFVTINFPTKGPPQNVEFCFIVSRNLVKQHKYSCITEYDTWWWRKVGRNFVLKWFLSTEYSDVAMQHDNWGGSYPYIFVFYTINFKSIVFIVCGHENIRIWPPPPIPLNYRANYAADGEFTVLHFLSRGRNFPTYTSHVPFVSSRCSFEILVSSSWPTCFLSSPFPSLCG